MLYNTIEMSSPSTRRTSRAIPDFPGALPKKPPAPPKYLVTHNNEVISVKGEPPEIRPQGMTAVPIAAQVAEVLPQRDFESPAHRFVKKRVDSKYEFKSSSRLSAMGQSVMGGSFSGSIAPPKLPARPRVPRPFVPPSAYEYLNEPMTHARTANGTIIGGATKRYVPANHVPYLPETLTVNVQHSLSQDLQVSSENPYKDIDDTWCACWDDEAGAVYYYNKLTGEATWLPPSSF